MKNSINLYVSRYAVAIKFPMLCRTGVTVTDSTERQVTLNKLWLINIFISTKLANNLISNTTFLYELHFGISINSYITKSILNETIP